jgi:hypothetical protein
VIEVLLTFLRLDLLSANHKEAHEPSKHCSVRNSEIKVGILNRNHGHFGSLF